MRAVARVCELLLASFGKAKQGQSRLWTRSEMASGRRDVRGAEAVDQGDGSIAQGGHDLWSVAGAQAGAVFLEGDIAHRMGTVCDAPMAAIELQQALGTSLGGGEGGDEINHLRGGCAGFGHAAGELSDLGDKGPVRSQIGVHLVTSL